MGRRREGPDAFQVEAGEDPLDEGDGKQADHGDLTQVTAGVLTGRSYPGGDLDTEILFVPADKVVDRLLQVLPENHPLVEVQGRVLFSLARDPIPDLSIGIVGHMVEDVLLGKARGMEVFEEVFVVSAPVGSLRDTELACLGRDRLGGVSDSQSLGDLRWCVSLCVSAAQDLDLLLGPSVVAVETHLLQLPADGLGTDAAEGPCDRDGGCRGLAHRAQGLEPFICPVVCHAPL